MTERLTDAQVNNLAVWVSWDLMPTVKEARALAQEVQDMRSKTARLLALHQPIRTYDGGWWDGCSMCGPTTNCHVRNILNSEESKCPDI